MYKPVPWQSLYHRQWGILHLGKESQKKLVLQILWTFPQRLAYKVTAIGEANIMKTIKLKELTGSLKAFELEPKENKKE